MSKEGVSFKNRDRFIQLGIAISTLRKLRLLGQSHYVNGGHKNGMNTRLLWILLHIILHISTFNHSS